MPKEHPVIRFCRNSRVFIVNLCFSLATCSSSRIVYLFHERHLFEAIPISRSNYTIPVTIIYESFAQGSLFHKCTNPKDLYLPHSLLEILLPCCRCQRDKSTHLPFTPKP
ncbi:hypothetical protein K432DRAFT_55082 [Lepidopterella palustris CBS 459.81]|uniref:Uncharacterized protein n=1 Tax=Lepidopterella palustris CBS 459.81 TaxID=1314670 RepID=A0A8E2E9W9_9PEZI|nr:hypothetical protein K432DRAFT_55082 [Lepidopterella palustris CBS 459.81]